MAKKNALGRGLGALLDENSIEKAKRPHTSFDIEISLISANPFQPRERFDEEALAELSISIQKLGVIQPITVKETGDGKFQLISGERRLRAAKMAGLTKIPAYIRKINDENLLEMALIENIQREDLDAIEIAIAYQRLMEECALTQEELSDRVGKKRSTVANYIRLLKLPPKVQIGIRNHQISMGHARALINLKDEETQLMIFEQILKYDFSVRKVEEVVRQLGEDEEKQAEESPVRNRRYTTDAEYEKLKKHLSKHFVADVDFKRYSTGKGKIIIPFSNDDDLERIISIIDKLNR